ncbi:MAG: cytochrome c biogenesis protein ResB [Planctomycetota bacterium]
MQNADAAAGRPAKGGAIARALRLLRSVRFALALTALIALACIAGTLVPQGPYDPNEAIARYGRVAGLLIGLLGLHRLYSTAWFLGLLGLFALSTATCTFSRGRPSLRTLGSVVVHASILLITAGAIARGLFGVNGEVALAEGETVKSFTTEDGEVPLGFELRLDDFDIRYYGEPKELLLARLSGDEAPRSIPVEVGSVISLAPDGTSIEVLRRIGDFRIDAEGVVSASDKPLNPAVEVRVRGPEGEFTEWLFARFPGFRGHDRAQRGLELRYVRQKAAIQAFESRVTVLNDQGAVTRQESILVNRPLEIGRYTLFQMDYDPKTEATSVLGVHHDPGIPLVYAGFVLLPLGLAYTFYVRPLLDRKASGDA